MFRRTLVISVVVGATLLTGVGHCADAPTANYGIAELAGAPIKVTGLVKADQDAVKADFSLKSLTLQGKQLVKCDDQTAITFEKGLLTAGTTPELAGTCAKLFWLQDGRSLSTITAVFGRTKGGADLGIALSPAHVTIVNPPSVFNEGKTSFALIDTGNSYTPNDKLYAFTSLHGWSSALLVTVNGKNTFNLGSKYSQQVLSSIAIAKTTADGYAIDAASITPQDDTPPSTPKKSEAADSTLPSTTTALDTAFANCVAPDRFENSFVVCLSVDARGAIELTSLPEGHIVRPNRPILVMVRHPNTVGVVVTLNGTRGIFAPGFNNQTLAQSASGTPPPAKAVSTEIVVHSFAPRLPGNLDLKVSSKPVDSTDTSITAQDDTEELIVDSTYGGAFRVGFGLVMGDAVDRAYSSVKAPGSSQSEIVASNSGALDMELVVGFAPFAEYLWGGRSYANKWNLTNPLFGFAPYVGVGVLAFNGGSIDAFKSLYLGVEWEPVPFFSIAVTWIGRRVTRLAEGAILGGPTSDGSVPTSTAFASGFGLVFNVSPDFLRVAAKQNGSLFK